jgi:hypothetical protein
MHIYLFISQQGALKGFDATIQRTRKNNPKKN